MKHFLLTACGAAAGTLISTAFIGSAQELHWARAIFIGIGCGCAALFWPRNKAG